MQEAGSKTALRTKVLIVSTYRTVCGIASFTETLESNLRQDFDIEIGVLDQDVLKSTDRDLESAGDRLIDDICRRAGQADVVNLQWEPGILGHTPRQILRRFRKILRSNPRMVVTVHTVVPNPRFSPVTALREMKHKGVVALARYAAISLREYGRETYRLLGRAARSSGFHLVVHTRREARHFKEMLGIANVHDHPLSFVRREWEDRLGAQADRLRAKLEAEHGSDRKFIGFFGFLSEYKGITTTIEAMRFLPSDHVLLLFGGVHPALQLPGLTVSPYVRDLMEMVHPAGCESEKSTRRSLADRVQFLGAPKDFDFAAAMAACDINVFPYVETGQSASGPVSLSVELGKRTVVSNNRMFEQFERYFPGRTYRTDVGNHIQLAQVVKRALQEPEPGTEGLCYTNRTMTAFYARIFDQAARRGT